MVAAELEEMVVKFSPVPEEVDAKRIQEIALPSALFQPFTPPVLKKYAAKILSETVCSIRDFKENGVKDSANNQKSSTQKN